MGVDRFYYTISDGRGGYSTTDVEVTVEYSVDLVNWVVGAVLESASTGEETWRSAVVFDDRAYWRVRVVEKE